MSDPDKKSGSGAEGSAVVLVDQSATSRHKQPFRASELQEETAELHHKRSKAPAVPSSVVEDFKDSTNTENKDKRLKENVSHSHAAKKLSSNKKRDSSPETITLVAMDAETKVGSISPPNQPIPAQVSVASTPSNTSIDKTGSEKKDDDITEEIAELRSPESTHKTTWETESRDPKKKEVSWNHENLNTIKINNSPNQGRKLERTTSVGPCFYPTTRLGRPSGIAISVPKKSMKSVRELYTERQSIINISIARKCQFDKNKFVIMDEPECRENQNNKSKFLGTLKEKMSNVGEKIKNYF